jgi:hypothetical protein
MIPGTYNGIGKVGVQPSYRVQEVDLSHLNHITAFGYGQYLYSFHAVLPVSWRSSLHVVKDHF